MNTVHIRYDINSKCLEMYDKENAQYIESGDVKDLFGHGFEVDHEEEEIVITVADKYSIQMLSNGSFTTIAECTSESVDFVFQSIWSKHHRETFRVLRNVDSSIYVRYIPEDGAIVGLED